MTTGIFVGLSTVDIVYRVDEFPAANAKVAAHSQDVFTGGPATNAAIAFSHLGGAATLVTTVGRHALAGVIRQELRRYSIRLIDLNPDFDSVPAMSSVSVRANGERNVVSANAARIPAPPAQVDEATLAQASVVLVDGHAMQACQAWAAAAHALGIPVVLDGGSWKPGAEYLLKTIDIAICSADFMPPGCFTQDDVLAYLKEAGVTSVAITNGPAPIRFAANASSGTMPVPQAEPVDTMGAGDIFHGAFCYFLSTGLGFVEALAAAANIAAESCRFHGPRAWMRHINPAHKRSSTRRYPSV